MSRRRVGLRRGRFRTAGRTRSPEDSWRLDGYAGELGNAVERDLERPHGGRGGEEERGGEVKAHEFGRNN